MDHVNNQEDGYQIEDKQVQNGSNGKREHPTIDGEQ